jgi:lambda family phage portal protein
MATPTHEAAGSGRRSAIWKPANLGAIAVIAEIGDALRAKSRDLVRRNAWANAGLESFVSNAIGTGIKPQSMAQEQTFRIAIQALWNEWTEVADVTGQTDFYGLQALACRAMAEGGECFLRLRPQPPDNGLIVPLQLQILESEHLPLDLNKAADNGNLIRSGIEFDADGKRVAYYLYPFHPNDGDLSLGGSSQAEPVRVEASEIIHLYRILRPGQIRGETWMSRALIKLDILDKYDDATLLRQQLAALIAGFITKNNPEDSTTGEATDEVITDVSWEPGTLQVLAPGESITFPNSIDVGANYNDYIKSQFRSIASAMNITYEQLTGDLSGVNYSSIRAGMLEFRRKMESFQHSVIVHQMCRPIWNEWLKTAVLADAIVAPNYATTPRLYTAVKWIPQGWSWVDPEKEYKAMQLAVRSGLMSRSEAVSAFGYDSEDLDREIAADNARADRLGLVFDTDPRKIDLSNNQVATPVEVPSETQPIAD